jgi:hypothetical protein
MARPTLDRNPKFKGLWRRLSISRPLARGHLEFLWDSANEYGNPVFADAEEVEDAAEWGGDPGVLCAVLGPRSEGGVGFLDRRDDGRLEIHDFWDHCPEYVRRRSEREAERRIDKTCERCGSSYRSAQPGSRFCSSACRTAACRERKKGESVTASNVTVTLQPVTVTPSPVTVTSRNTTPAPAPAPIATTNTCSTDGPVERVDVLQSEPAVPDEPPPKTSKKKSEQKADRAFADRTGFNEFYDPYPRHTARADAERAWRRDLEDSDRKAAIAAAPRFAEYHKAKRTEKQHIPMPATYLRNRRWEDELDLCDSGGPRLRNTPDADDAVAFLESMRRNQ